MDSPSKGLRPRARRWVIALTVLGLAIAAVILALPPRQRALAEWELATVGSVLAALRAAIGAIQFLRLGQRFNAAMMVLLAAILLLLGLTSAQSLLDLWRGGA